MLVQLFFTLFSELGVEYRAALFNIYMLLKWFKCLVQAEKGLVFQSNKHGHLWLPNGASVALNGPGNNVEKLIYIGMLGIIERKIQKKIYKINAAKFSMNSTRPVLCDH